MRRRTGLIGTVLLTAALTAGCTTGPGNERSAPPPPSTVSVDPRNVAPCIEARKTVVAATQALEDQVESAASAAERDDTGARDRAAKAARVVLRDWAAKLRTQAERAEDAKLKATLSEYGGAVDAVGAGVRTADDLADLETFDGTEIDVAASRFSEVCG